MFLDSWAKIYPITLRNQIKYDTFDILANPDVIYLAWKVLGAKAWPKYLCVCDIMMFMIDNIMLFTQVAPLVGHTSLGPIIKSPKMCYYNSFLLLQT